MNNEGFPRPPTWNELLRERVPAGELMTLENIDLGFIRPRTPLDWQMAYCKANCTSITWSPRRPEAVGKLLEAYREGLDTTAALKKACGADSGGL